MVNGLAGKLVHKEYKYYDKNGDLIKEGDTLVDPSGCSFKVYSTGDGDLGAPADKEAEHYLFYPLSVIRLGNLVIKR